MPQKILITRPQYDADILAKQIKALGREAIIEPMLIIENIKTLKPDLIVFDGFVFTSANGVRAYAEISNFRDLPVFTVGDKTADEAINIGFKNVQSVAADVAALATFLKRQKGTYAHFRGLHVKEPLSVLTRVHDGIEIEEFIVYEAVKVDDFSSSLLKSLGNNEVSHALFYSKRTAENFINLAVSQNCTHYFEHIKALCLADSMVECLSVLPWKKIKVAEHADEKSLLNLLK